MDNSNNNTNNTSNNSVNGLNNVTPVMPGSNNVPQPNNESGNAIPELNNATPVMPGNNVVPVVNVVPIMQQNNNQVNNDISNNVNNSSSINQISNDSFNNQLQNNNQIDNNVNTINNDVSNNAASGQQINQNDNGNNIQNNQINSSENIQNDDEELLRAFVGEKYDKIKAQSFNIPGFFFTSLYMFYRKMFGYAILLFVLTFIVINVIKIPFVALGFNVIVGLFVNKMYLSFARKKVASIKSSNSGKSIEELKNICSNKGGTSVGKIFLGIFTEIIVAFAMMFIMLVLGIGNSIIKVFDFKNWDMIINDRIDFNSNTGSKDGTLVEDVSVGGYTCFNGKCNITIRNSNGDETTYILSTNNNELIEALGDYKDYIKLDIYYQEKGSEKGLVDYKIYLKSSNEDISNVQSIDELREKIGLYSLGMHTDTFTLSEIGSTGFGFSNDTSYSYTDFTFIDKNNIEYEMRYIDSPSTDNLVEGNKYSVTFEVVEGMFGYEFNIKSIE